MAGFDDATRATLVDGSLAAGRWSARAELDPDWRVLAKPNGGYLLAVLARAAVVVDGLPPHPVAVSAHYLRAPDVGPATLTVELLRQGTRLAALRVGLEQDGSRCVEGLVTLSTLRPAATPWYDGVPRPDLPPPERCVRADGTRPELPVPMLGVVEELVDPATVGWAQGRPGGSAELRAWLRHEDGREPDPFALLHAVDALPPATFDLGSTGWVPTVELTAYVRALPAAGPLVVRQRARLVDGGTVDEECDVWDARGRLVATGHQLAGLRVPEAPPVRPA